MAEPVGRPKKFKSPEELQERIDAYFAECDSHPVEITDWVYDEKKKKSVEVKTMVMSDPKPYTVTGLCVFLGCDGDTLLNYEKDYKFFGTIKMAKMKIQAYAESQLFRLGNNGGVIFNLKNNFGWKDKMEHDLTSKGDKLEGFNITIVDPKQNDS